MLAQPGQQRAPPLPDHAVEVGADIAVAGGMIGAQRGPAVTDAGVLTVVILAHEPAHPQHPEVPTHRGWTRADGIGELTCATWTHAQQIDHATARGIGEREQRAVEIRHYDVFGLRMR